MQVSSSAWPQNLRSYFFMHSAKFFLAAFASSLVAACVPIMIRVLPSGFSLTTLQFFAVGSCAI